MPIPRAFLTTNNRELSKSSQVCYLAPFASRIGDLVSLRCTGRLILSWIHLCHVLIASDQRTVPADGI